MMDQVATVLSGIGEGTGITDAVILTPMENTSMGHIQMVIQEASYGTIGSAMGTPSPS